MQLLSLLDGKLLAHKGFQNFYSRYFFGKLAEQGDIVLKHFTML